MKKSLCILLIILLLSFLVVSAEDTRNDSEEQVKTLDEEKLKETFDLNKIRNIESEIKLPNYIQKPTRLIFQIEEDKEIKIEYFIVLICLFLILLVIITGTISMTPLHKEPTELFIFKINTDYLIGLIVTLIIALTGVIDMVASDWLFSFKLYQELVEKMGTWSIILIIFLFILLFIAFKTLFKKLKEKLILEQAKTDGENVKMMNKMAEIKANEMIEN